MNEWDQLRINEELTFYYAQRQEMERRVAEVEAAELERRAKLERKRKSSIWAWLWKGRPSDPEPVEKPKSDAEKSVEQKIRAAQRFDTVRLADKTEAQRLKNEADRRIKAWKNRKRS